MSASPPIASDFGTAANRRGVPRPAMVPLPCACESDVALPQSCQQDVPRSYFCGGSGDAVGRHLTQTFNFAVCSHRVPALDCARDIAKTAEGNVMKLPRRRFLRLAAGAAALPAVSPIARAQAYPTRPVRLIVPLRNIPS